MTMFRGESLKKVAFLGPRVGMQAARAVTGFVTELRLPQTELARRIEREKVQNEWHVLLELYKAGPPNEAHVDVRGACLLALDRMANDNPGHSDAVLPATREGFAAGFQKLLVEIVSAAEADQAAQSAEAGGLQTLQQHLNGDMP